MTHDPPQTDKEREFDSMLNPEPVPGRRPELPAAYRKWAAGSRARWAKANPAHVAFVQSSAWANKFVKGAR